jgi:pimeloyl-ACP methyl ester carboxylesterase
MKQWAIILSFFFSFGASAQSFVGTWEGRLQFSNALRIVFIFGQKDGQLTAKWQSLDQTKAILPTDTCYSIGDSIFVIAKKFGIGFRGYRNSDSTINGVFTQGADIPLPLKKVTVVSEQKRPQLPKGPYSYQIDEVEFKNRAAAVQLSGTLTYPKPLAGVEYLKPPTYPAVILISGSGPQDRDETIFGHKPFAVMADDLTKKGFAVLRYDERGVGKSTGKFDVSTTADFASDAASAIEFLKQQPQIDTAHIGLIGHSEGGLIAPMLAAQRNDIAFIVLLAGPGLPSTALMQEQVSAVMLSQGQSAAAATAGGTFYKEMAKAVNSSKDTAIIFKNALQYANQWAKKQPDSILTMLDFDIPEDRAEVVRAQLQPMMTPWFRYFLALDPRDYLTKLHCNVLALNGDKDIQVIGSSNLKAIKEALKKSQSPRQDVIALPGLNHLFQTCKTCSAPEYGELEETISPLLLQVMGDWLLQYGR